MTEILGFGDDVGLEEGCGDVSEAAHGFGENMNKFEFFMKVYGGDGLMRIVVIVDSLGRFLWLTVLPVNPTWTLPACRHVAFIILRNLFNKKRFGEIFVQ